MDTTTQRTPQPDSFQKAGAAEYATCARITPNDLTPGVSLLCDDPEQPAVTIVARTPRGGVRWLLGDQRWHWRADDLARALERAGYEVAL